MTDHTLAFLHDPSPDLDLAGLLIGFITDLRRIIIQPEIRPDVKLALVEKRVDLLAPPPRADGSTGPL